MYRRFFACCRSHTRRRKVEIAHMELAEPSIGAAVAKCVSEGYRKVVVAPYFLSRGRHITSDIPAMVAEAQRAHPGISCVIADPIGVPPASNALPRAACSCACMPCDSCSETGLIPYFSLHCLHCYGGSTPADLHADVPHNQSMYLGC